MRPRRGSNPQPPDRQSGTLKSQPVDPINDPTTEKQWLHSWLHIAPKDHSRIPREIDEEVFEAIYNNRDLEEIAERWEDLSIAARKAILTLVRDKG